MTSGIYKLTFKKTGEIYVGSSINIEKRFRGHTLDIRAHALNPGCINTRHGCLKKTCFLLTCDPWDIDAVRAEFECEVLEVVEDRAMLLGREQYWYDALNPSLNKVRPSRSHHRGDPV